MLWGVQEDIISERYAVRENNYVQLYLDCDNDEAKTSLRIKEDLNFL